MLLYWKIGRPLDQLIIQGEVRRDGGMGGRIISVPTYTGNSSEPAVRAGKRAEAEWAVFLLHACTGSGNSARAPEQN